MSCVGVVTRLMADRSSFFSSAQGLDRLCGPPNLLPNEYVERFHGVKRSVCEVYHSPPFSAEVRNAWGYTSTPPYAFMAWCLIKQRDNLGDRLPVCTPVSLSSLLTSSV
jgi:hypothetical protein